MRVGASREKQGDAIAVGTGDVDDELVALLDRPVGAVKARISRDQRESAHEFAAAAEFTRRRDVGPLGMLAGDHIGREAQGSGRSMEMATLRPAQHREALQHLGLERRAKALRRREAPAAGGVLQVRDGLIPSSL